MAANASLSEPSAATATEPPVVPSSTAESVPATPPDGAGDDEKHNPTTPSSPVDDEKRHSTADERRPSLHHHASSPLPEHAPVLGAGGFVLEDEEKADAAATAFKHHQSLPPAHHEHAAGLEKKGPHVVEENGVATTGTTTETETQEESEAEADEEIVFPGTTQLALLTFGLCVAIFTVALGTLLHHLVIFSPGLLTCIRESHDVVITQIHMPSLHIPYERNLLTRLDNTIIATAIPKITSVFDSLQDVGWYG